MKKLLLILLTCIILMMTLAAQTLPVDSRKIPMQFNKSFGTLRVSPAADAWWDTVTLPANTVEVLILPVTGSIDVCADSVNVGQNYIGIAAGIPMKLPVYHNTKIYVRRTAAGTASVANILFLKM